MRDCWDNIKHTNIHIIVVPEGEEREQAVENLFKEKTDNFLDLAQVQEVQRVPNKMNPKRPTPRHMIIKC